MKQAALTDGFVLYPPSLLQDGWRSAEVGISRRDIAEALVDPAVVVVIDEGIDGFFERARHVVVLEQDAVLHRLMPPLYLALGHRVVRCSPRMFNVLLLKPGLEFTTDVARPVVR